MVCHFSNSDVRKKLHLSSYRYVNKLRRFMGFGPEMYYDFAQWNRFIIYNSKDYDNIELHMIAPHYGMKKKTETFIYDGTICHFFKPGPSVMMKYIDRKFFGGKLVSFRGNQKIVHSVINEINPDIILLIGAESPYYSRTILGISNIPIYVLCQSVVNNPEFENAFDSVSYQKAIKCELDVLNSTNYVGVYCDKHHDLYRKCGYQGYIFRFKWPRMPNEFELKSCEKVYDFVNFANHLSSEKGYHDCIQALAIVKKTHPSVKLALVCRESQGPVYEELVSLVSDLDLQNNVTLLPFFERKEDLLQFLLSVRFGVLPCKVDYISGTMIQTMQLGLPTVVYKTEGTPTINVDGEAILIAEMCDVNDLAMKMLTLMDNPQKCESLRQNAYHYIAKQDMQNANNMEGIIQNIYSILDNFQNGTPIPVDQIYQD